jgi:acetolactate synthase I/II/III large subunit
VLRGRGLQAAGRIAAATGCRLISDTFAPRVERGAGRVTVQRLPFRPGPAVDFLGGIQTLILVGTHAPIAFFAYPDSPSELTPSGCVPLVLAQPHEDGSAALEAVADAIGAKAPPVVASFRSSDAPEGNEALTNEAVMRIISRFMPEHAIISDESITSGAPYYALLDTAAPCDYLQVPGGSIGGGIPLATGAAVACPDRKVISLEGDGSAMYTLQALWTLAREKLDVTTVIYANHSYGILQDELKNVGAAEGAKALSLLELRSPSLEWVHLARGMGVDAVQVDTRRGFSAAFKSAMDVKGPFLIEAIV